MLRLGWLRRCPERDWEPDDDQKAVGPLSFASLLAVGISSLLEGSLRVVLKVVQAHISFGCNVNNRCHHVLEGSPSCHSSGGAGGLATRIRRDVVRGEQAGCLERACMCIMIRGGAVGEIRGEILLLARDVGT